MVFWFCSVMIVVVFIVDYEGIVCVLLCLLFCMGILFSGWWWCYVLVWVEIFEEDLGIDFEMWNVYVGDGIVVLGVLIF